MTNSVAEADGTRPCRAAVARVGGHRLRAVGASDEQLLLIDRGRAGRSRVDDCRRWRACARRGRSSGMSPLTPMTDALTCRTGPAAASAVHAGGSAPSIEELWRSSATVEDGRAAPGRCAGPGAAAPRARHGPRVPGLAEHGLTSGAARAWSMRMRRSRRSAAGRAVVGIFGMPHSCPPAPYELALLLADRLDERGVDAEVSVFTPAPDQHSPIARRGRLRALDARLAERGSASCRGPAATARDAQRACTCRRTPSVVACDLLLARAAALACRESSGRRPGCARSRMAGCKVDRVDATRPRTLGVWAIGDCTAIALVPTAWRCRRPALLCSSGRARCARPRSIAAALLRGEAAGRRPSTAAAPASWRWAAARRA